MLLRNTVYRGSRIKRIIVAAVVDVSLLFDCSGQLVLDIGRPDAQWGPVVSSSLPCLPPPLPFSLLSLLLLLSLARLY
jgi:hypothetical protein